MSWPLTPQVSQWVSSVNGSSEVLGFVQWKPVAYRQSDPVLEDATPCHHADPQPQSGEAVAAASGLIRAFFAEPETFGLNVSFGLAGEPFYNSTKFLSWSDIWWFSFHASDSRGNEFFNNNSSSCVSCRTVLVGSGSPPIDSLSPLVLSMMAVGLGTPMILLLLGGVCVCVRKRVPASTTAYEPINWQLCCSQWDDRDCFKFVFKDSVDGQVTWRPSSQSGPRRLFKNVLFCLLVSLFK